MPKISRISKFSKKQLTVFIVGLVGVGLLLAWFIQAATSNPRIYLAPNSVTVEQGASFTTEVRVDTGGQDVSYVRAAYSYPSDQLDLVSVDYANSQFPLDLKSTTGNGTILISRGPNLGTSPVNGDVLLATLTFKAKTTASGTGDLTFDNNQAQLISNTSLTNLLAGGTGSVVQSTVTINNTPPPPPPPAKVAIASISPDTQSVAANANFSVTVRINSQAEAMNSVVAKVSYPANLADFVSASAVGSAFSKVVTPSAAAGGIVSINQSLPAGAAPVNGDQLLVTLNFKAKAGATGNGNLSFAAGTSVLDSAGNDIYKDGVAAALGFQGAPPPPPPPPPPPAPKATLSLSPATQSVDFKGNFTLAVRVDSPDPINSVGIKLTYPADKVDFIGASSAGSPFGLVALAGEANNGVISVEQALLPGTGNVTGDQLVTTLSFSAKSTAAGTSNFTFTTGTVAYRPDGTNTLKEVVSASVSYKGAPVPPTPTPSPAPAPGPITIPPVTHHTNSGTGSINSGPGSQNSNESNDNTEETNDDSSNLVDSTATSSIELVIVDKDGKPVANKKVTIAGKTENTDDLGKVKFKNIAPGEYEVTVDGKKVDNKITVKAFSDTTGVQSFNVSVATANPGLGSLPAIIVGALILLLVAATVAVIVKKRGGGGPKSSSKAAAAKTIKPDKSVLGKDRRAGEKPTSGPTLNSSSINTKVYYPKKKTDADK